MHNNPSVQFFNFLFSYRTQFEKKLLKVTNQKINIINYKIGILSY